MSALLILCISAGTVVLGYLWIGFVLSILWVWFIVPVFDLPVLTVLQAIGLSLTIGFITRNHQSSNKDSSIGSTIGLAFFWPLMVLVIGWIVHTLM